jgi:hypothetical protein
MYLYHKNASLAYQMSAVGLYTCRPPFLYLQRISAPRRK